MKVKILVVDDEVAICSMLSLALQTAGYEVESVHDGKDVMAALANTQPDLILLDWMLPGVSGIELARQIKQSPDFNELPIIMLTARTEEDSKVTGLESGADDYVTKPFSIRELVSRIKAVLRRRSPSLLEQQIIHGDLVMDVLSQRVSVQEAEVSLGPTEYKLLEFFMRNPDRVFSREQLLNRVWGSTVYVEDRTVDVHILRLRKALKPAGVSHLINTVRGSGYRLAKA